MATLDELNKKAGTAKNPDSVMSAADQARIEYYRELYNKATDQATRDAAHKAAEDVRQQYGYSGGVDGSQYITEGVQPSEGDHYDVSLSDTEQRKVDDLRVKYYAALANGNEGDMARYHDQAEQIRANSVNGGYSGGTDGSEYIPIKKTAAVEGYTGSAPQVKLPDVPAFESLKVPEFTAMQIPTTPDVEINDYSQYIQEMQQAQLDATLAEYEQAYQQNVNAIDRAGVGVDEAYQDARNQTAGAADLANRNFAEVANASGLNSGTGGQAALARGVALQNNMNALNLQEAQSLADLEQQRADNTVRYDTAIAQATAQGKQQEAQLLYQEKIRVESATIEAIQQKFANEVTTYQLQMDAAQQQFADEVTKKQLEYQELRDSVADAQWQAEFDLAYEQWMKNVELQQAEMIFQREQWEQDVVFQLEQLEMQKKSLDAELGQMEISNNQWQQEFNASTGRYQDEVIASDAYKAVNEDLVAMVKAGAGQTEIRAALRGARNEGILPQTEYEQLCAVYTPGWRA